MKWIKAVALALLSVEVAQGATIPERQPIAASLQFPDDGMLSFKACQRWIADSAKPYRPVVIETVITGPIQRLAEGVRIAPLFVRMVYEREGGRETRKSHIECTIDANGAVTAVVEVSP
jgi:hypothetical protein